MAIGHLIHCRPSFVVIHALVPIFAYALHHVSVCLSHPTYTSSRSSWICQLCSSPTNWADGHSSLHSELHTECCQPSCWHCINRSWQITCHSDIQCPHHPLSAEEPQWELLLQCNQHSWECCHLPQPLSHRCAHAVMDNLCMCVWRVGHGKTAKFSAKCIRQWDVVFGWTFSISFVCHSCICPCIV